MSLQRKDEDSPRYFRVAYQPGMSLVQVPRVQASVFERTSTSPFISYILHPIRFPLTIAPSAHAQIRKHVTAPICASQPASQSSITKRQVRSVFAPARQWQHSQATSYKDASRT